MTTFEENWNKQHRKPKAHSFRSWWSKNGYKVLRVIFFPVWFWEVASDMRYKALAWDEARATEVLNETLPSILEQDVDEPNAFYYSPDWCSSFYDRKGIRRKHKAFARKFDFRLHQFLTDGYELKGYKKTWETDPWGSKFLVFKKEG